MTVKEFYDSIGGDYESMVSRIPSDDMIRMFLGQFEEESCCDELREAVERKNVHDAFDCAHALKGLAANFSLRTLYEATSELVEQLRPEPGDIDIQLYQAVIREYEKIISTIHCM